MATIFFGIADRVYNYDKTIGRQEFTGSGFRTPMDMTLGQSGVIYVVSRCWEYRPDGVHVTILNADEDYLGQFSQFGDKDGDLWWPVGINHDSSENIYVTDDWLHRVSVFDKEGNFLHRWGDRGTGDGQIEKPAGIALDKADNVYLVDSGNHRIQKFTREGKFLSKWGGLGSGQGQFNLPWGVTIDDKGDVFVADWRNDRIQKFTADGTFLAEFGGPGTEAGEFQRPTGVGIDKHGDIYVADWGNDRVQALTPDGRHITTFEGEADLSKWAFEKLNSNPDMYRQRALMRDKSEERHLWRPKAVEIDDQGRVMILDANRGRIQVYRRENY